MARAFRPGRAADAVSARGGLRRRARAAREREEARRVLTGAVGEMAAGVEGDVGDDAAERGRPAREVRAASVEGEAARRRGDGVGSGCCTPDPDPFVGGGEERRAGVGVGGASGWRLGVRGRVDRVWVGDRVRGGGLVGQRGGPAGPGGPAGAEASWAARPSVGGGGFLIFMFF